LVRGLSQVKADYIAARARTLRSLSAYSDDVDQSFQSHADQSFQSHADQFGA